LFGRKNFFYSFIQGLSVLLAVIFVFIWFFQGNPSNEYQARTLSFVTLVIANISLIVVNLSGSRSLLKTITAKNKAFWFVMIGALLSLILIIIIPPLQSLFRFSPVTLIDFLLAAFIGFIAVAWFKVVDLVKRKHFHKSG
jgi:Ca2+-transporting ATPase